MLLRLQHAEADPPTLRLDRRSTLLRLLRAYALNHRIGTIHPQNGATQYYLSLTPGAWKTFSTEDNSFWCCTGTGIEEYSKLNDSIYWRDSEGVYVNLFIPSELHWAEKGFRLRQDTSFPETAGTSLMVGVDRPTKLAMRLRIPAWVESGTSIKINGRPLDVSAAPGGYIKISRVWNNGDRIEVDLPMGLHIESMPDDSRMQAILYGPLVLAGDLGSQGLTEAMIIGPNAPRSQHPPIAIPSFRTTSADPRSWIQPADKPLTFHTTGQEKNVELTPLNSIFDRRYSVYWQVS